MAQVKIYGLKGPLSAHRQALSDAIQEALGEAFGLPLEKRFQRFMGLEAGEFIFPPTEARTTRFWRFRCSRGVLLKQKRS